MYFRSCSSLIASIVTFAMLGASAYAQQLDINRMLDLGVEILRTMPSNAPPRQQPQQARPVPQTARPQQARPAAPDPGRAQRVREIQAQLTRKGYDPGPIDGAFGPRTAAAIRAFQADRGLPQVGAPTPALLGQLAAAPDAALPRVSADPSFDCARAALPSERAICASGELAALDRQLSAAYNTRRFAASESERAELAQAQRRWVESRNQCGDHEGCLSAMMTARMAILGVAPATTAAAPRPAPAADDEPVAVPVVTAFGEGLRDIDPIIVEGRLLTGDPLYDLGFDDTAERVPFVRGDRPKAVVDLALALDLALLRQWPQILERDAMAREYADRFLLGAARDDYICGDDCQRGVPFAGWRGGNEFEREAAYRAFLDEIAPRLTGQAQEFPVGLRSVHEAEVLAYDYEREGFPLRFKRNPSQPSVTAGISPVAGLAIHDADEFADFVPVPRDAAQAWLARVGAADNSGERVAWLAVDIRLVPAAWSEPGWGPEVTRGIDAMRLTAAPDGGAVLHSFPRPEPEPAPEPGPDQVSASVPPQAYVLKFGAEAIGRETWLELAERQINWDQQATKDPSNGTELFARHEVAGRDAAFAAEDMLTAYQARLAAALAPVSTRATVTVSKDIERNGTKWFHYEGGALHGSRAVGRPEPWLQRIDSLDERARLRFAPLGSRALYRNLDLIGWLPAEGLPNSVLRMRQARPHLALDRRLEVPPIPIERDAAEALFVPPPSCTDERQAYQDTAYSSDARDAAIAALQACDAVRQAYGEVKTRFELEIDGAVHDSEQGWVLTGRVLGATVEGPHGNVLREFSPEELPAATDVWRTRLDAEAAETAAAQAEVRAAAEAEAAAAAAAAAEEADVAARMAGTDLAGLRLGMPLAEAEAIVRESIDVGWVGRLNDAERAERRGAPYLDYRIYIASDRSQSFVLYAGPEGSGADGEVVAAARSLRVPGEVRDALAGQLEAKYGTPLDAVDGGTGDLIWTAHVGENGFLLENAGAAVAFDHGPCSTDMTGASRIWDSHELLEGSEDDRAFYLMGGVGEPLLRVSSRRLEDVSVWSACGPTVVADLREEDGRDGPVTELRYVLFDHAAYLPHHQGARVSAQEAPVALPDL